MTVVDSLPALGVVQSAAAVGALDHVAALGGRRAELTERLALSGCAGASVQLAPPGSPGRAGSGLGSSVKVTQPMGVALSPASVSETVALQEPVSCSASEAGQAIVVEVERR